MAAATKVERKVLENGLTVVVERLPHIPSVTAGVWVKMGSRHESKKLNGASHFIEHLLFKGTPARSYPEIYKTFDRMGGQLDAFTSREIMGFYVRVQKYHFAEAFEILSDMLAHPLFPEEELERERGVILEEIKMVNDTPSDLMGDLFVARAYPGHPLGRPVQGTVESVSSVTRRQIRTHYRRMIQPQNMVVTATGDTNMEELLRILEPVLAKLPKGKSALPKAPRYKPGIELFRKNHLEQAQITLGFESEPVNGPNRFPLIILANLLGGTMSSRLFTELRERLGLVYSISAEHAGFTDAGLFVVTAATGHAQARKTLRAILGVLADVLKNGVSEEELDIARENLIGGLILSMESPSARMGRLARNEVFFGGQRTLKDALRGIRKVAVPELRDLAEHFFCPDRALVGVMGRAAALKGLDLDILKG